jgi:hypothetical protein
MSSKIVIPPNQQFQFRLTKEEWISAEFERVTIQYEKLLDILDQVRFIGINGLIQRENKKISPFYFQIVSENEEDFLIIAFSIPIFQSLDSIALQTGMEYFAAILKHMFCEKKPTHEAEVAAFIDIKRLLPIRYRDNEITPYEDFTEKIEVQLRMRVRMGSQIIPFTTINEIIRSEKMGNLKELRKAKSALANIQSNLREYSQQISKIFRVNVAPFLFQIEKDNRFEPLIIPIFSLKSVNQYNEMFSVLIINEEIIKRIPERHLEFMLVHEILYDLLRKKFSRGILEREIYLILSENGKNDPEFFIEKEMNKFFNLQEIQDARRKIKDVIHDLIDENYPILPLE